MFPITKLVVWDSEVGAFPFFFFPGQVIRLSVKARTGTFTRVRRNAPFGHTLETDTAGAGGGEDTHIYNENKRRACYVNRPGYIREGPFSRNRIFLSTMAFFSNAAFPLGGGE